ncbi:unnamed protein product [Amoebophrya sp. A120]|nr:unnamed protein product [Amoebophrya sp. A120]|eukprot:GSA120T00016647001.1
MSAPSALHQQHRRSQRQDEIAGTEEESSSQKRLATSSMAPAVSQDGFPSELEQTRWRRVMTNYAQLSIYTKRGKPSPRLFRTVAVACIAYWSVVAFFTCNEPAETTSRNRTVLGAAGVEAPTAVSPFKLSWFYPTFATWMLIAVLYFGQRFMEARTPRRVWPALLLFDTCCFCASFLLFVTAGNCIFDYFGYLSGDPIISREASTVGNDDVLPMPRGVTKLVNIAKIMRLQYHLTLFEVFEIVFVVAAKKFRLPVSLLNVYVKTMLMWAWYVAARHLMLCAEEAVGQARSSAAQQEPSRVTDLNFFEEVPQSAASASHMILILFVMNLFSLLTYGYYIASMLLAKECGSAESSSNTQHHSSRGGTVTAAVRPSAISTSSARMASAATGGRNTKGRVSIEDADTTPSLSDCTPQSSGTCSDNCEEKLATPRTRKVVSHSTSSSAKKSAKFRKRDLNAKRTSNKVSGDIFTGQDTSETTSRVSCSAEDDKRTLSLSACHAPEAAADQTESCQKHKGVATLLQESILAVVALCNSFVLRHFPALQWAQHMILFLHAVFQFSCLLLVQTSSPATLNADFSSSFPSPLFQDSWFGIEQIFSLGPLHKNPLLHITNPVIPLLELLVCSQLLLLYVDFNVHSQDQHLSGHNKDGKEHQPEARFCFSFDSCGWLYVYHWGVATFIYDHLSCGTGEYPAELAFSGASGGALVAGALALGLNPMDVCFDTIRQSGPCRWSIFEAFRLCDRTLAKWVPASVSHCTGRLRILMTRLSFWRPPFAKGQVVTQFEDRTHFIQCLRASSHIPLLGGLFPYFVEKYRAYYVDGLMWLSLFVHWRTFSPSDYVTRVSATGVYPNADISPRKTFPAWWAIFPPGEEVLEGMFWQGYLDCKAHFERNHRTVPRVCGCSCRSSPARSKTGSRSSSKDTFYHGMIRNEDENCGAFNAEALQPAHQRTPLHSGHSTAFATRSLSRSFISREDCAAPGRAAGVSEEQEEQLSFPRTASTTPAVFLEAQGEILSSDSDLEEPDERLPPALVFQDLRRRSVLDNKPSSRSGSKGFENLTSSSFSDQAGDRSSITFSQPDPGLLIPNPDSNSVASVDEGEGRCVSTDCPTTTSKEISASRTSPRKRGKRARNTSECLTASASEKNCAAAEQDRATFSNGSEMKEPHPPAGPGIGKDHQDVLSRANVNINPAIALWSSGTYHASLSQQRLEANSAEVERLIAVADHHIETSWVACFMSFLLIGLAFIAFS